MQHTIVKNFYLIFLIKYAHFVSAYIKNTNLESGLFLLGCYTIYPLVFGDLGLDSQISTVKSRIRSTFCVHLSIPSSHTDRNPQHFL